MKNWRVNRNECRSNLKVSESFCNKCRLLTEENLEKKPTSALKIAFVSLIRG